MIGNGDVFRWRDAKWRLGETGCAAVMVGRWALAKTGLFREFQEERDFELTADQRLAVVRRYVELCRAHFGDDVKGRARTRRFLVFHQDFFRRYRRNAALEGADIDDPRAAGEAPANELEAWLCRSDLEGVNALARWLVDGEEVAPPPPGPDAVRAVKVAALG